MRVEPVTLCGRHARLEPLGPDHLDPLWAVADHPGIWTYMPMRMATKADLAAWIDHLLDERRAGRALAFATVSLQDDKPVGMTSFLEIQPSHRRLEIGGTWITPAHQRSAVNTEAKYLQLCHCFDVLGCIRVELKTDSLNARSRAAIERIGGIEEGTFRNHMIMPDGRIRHSVYFSITSDRWPQVKRQLESRLTPG